MGEAYLEINIVEGASYSLYLCVPLCSNIGYCGGIFAHSFSSGVAFDLEHRYEDNRKVTPIGWPSVNHSCKPD